MDKQRRPRSVKSHYALLVNKAATNYQQRSVAKLISAIRAKGGAYTLYEPKTPTDTLHQAEVALGYRRANKACPRPYYRAGKVTALIACGGDGTFNLAGRAALKTDIPVGCLPMGRFNNIDQALNGTTGIDTAITRIVGGKHRLIDSATAAGVTFFGSVGMGFMVELAQQLQDRGTPRFSLGWSKMGARAAGEVQLHKTILKVDAFQFEIRPIILNINLLSHSNGLPLTPASVADDGLAEIVFDRGDNVGNFSSFTRLILKKKYLYGDDVRLYRGKTITCQSVKGRRLYLDGELISVPNESLEIQIGEKQLHVLV